MTKKVAASRRLRDMALKFGVQCSHWIIHLIISKYFWGWSNFFRDCRLKISGKSRPRFFEKWRQKDQKVGSTKRRHDDHPGPAPFRWPAEALTTCYVVCPCSDIPLQSLSVSECYFRGKPLAISWIGDIRMQMLVLLWNINPPRVYLMDATLVWLQSGFLGSVNLCI